MGTGFGIRPDDEAVWRETLTHGRRPTRLFRIVNRLLPSPPRCKYCYRPFGGIGGKVMLVTGFRRSRKNPELCTF